MRMRQRGPKAKVVESVVTSGGGQPNVVPPAAEVWYYIRANRHADVEQYFECGGQRAVIVFTLV